VAARFQAWTVMGLCSSMLQPAYSPLPGQGNFFLRKKQPSPASFRASPPTAGAGREPRERGTLRLAALEGKASSRSARCALNRTTKRATGGRCSLSDAGCRARCCRSCPLTRAPGRPHWLVWTRIPAALSLPARATEPSSSSDAGLAFQPPGLSNGPCARRPAPDNVPLTRPGNMLALRARQSRFRGATVVVRKVAVRQDRPDTKAARLPALRTGRKGPASALRSALKAGRLTPGE